MSETPEIKLLKEIASSAQARAFAKQAEHAHHGPVDIADGLPIDYETETIISVTHD